METKKRLRIFLALYVGLNFIITSCDSNPKPIKIYWRTIKENDISSRNRSAKQIIGASVVTTKSILSSNESSKKKSYYEKEYEKYNVDKHNTSVTQPIFEFYLYSDDGELIQEKLSIHDIQIILLQYSGITNLTTLLGRNSSKIKESTISTPTTTNHDDASVIDRIHGIIASVQQHHDKQEDISLVSNLTTTASNHNDDKLNHFLESLMIETVTHEDLTSITSTSTSDYVETTGDNSDIHETTVYDENNLMSTTEKEHINLDEQPNLINISKTANISSHAELNGIDRPSPIASWLNNDSSPKANKSSGFPFYLASPSTALLVDDFNVGSATTNFTFTSDKSTTTTTWSWMDPKRQQQLAGLQMENYSHASPSSTQFKKPATRPIASSSSSLITLSAKKTTKDISITTTTTKKTTTNALPLIIVNETEHHSHNHHHHHHDEFHPTNLANVSFPVNALPNDNIGLHASTQELPKSLRHFVNINNDLGLELYKRLVRQKNGAKNMIFSPLAASTNLAMIFLGARGNTSWQINSLLRLDEMISFNPHLLYKNITESLQQNYENIVAACTKQLYIDQDEGEILEFYKSRVGYFYSGIVDKIDFENIGLKIHNQTNEMVAMKTRNIIKHFMGNLSPQADKPMAVFSGNYLKGKLSDQADFNSKINFINLFRPRERRLLSIPAISFKMNRFMAGYDDKLDATAIEIPFKNNILSLILVLPGKQTEFLANGGIEKLETNLNASSWNALLKKLAPLSVDLRFPVFRHRSILELNSTLVNMGMKDAFEPKKADFTGINGGKKLKLSSFLQMNEFDITPNSKEKETIQRKKRRVGKQSSTEITYKLHFDRQFVYFVRHNPTGVIIIIGRYHHPHEEHQDVHHHDHHHHHPNSPHKEVKVH